MYRPMLLPFTQEGFVPPKVPPKPKRAPRPSRAKKEKPEPTTRPARRIAP